MAKTNILTRPVSSLQPSLPRTEVLVAAGVAAVLGVIILFGVGFAGPDLVHNAAHDTRHSINAPCH